MKKLLKAGFIALMMVGSLASCTDGVREQQLQPDKVQPHLLQPSQKKMAN